MLSENKRDQRDLDVCNGSDVFTGPYRIDVFAADVTDVVTCAGGWLYDQSAGGWRVTVAIANSIDPRPLQILGVHVVDLALALPLAESGGCVLGVGSDDPESDRHIGRLVFRNLRTPRPKSYGGAAYCRRISDFYAAAPSTSSARRRVLSNSRPSSLRAPIR